MLSHGYHTILIMSNIESCGTLCSNNTVLEFHYAKCLNTDFSTEIRGGKSGAPPTTPPLNSGPSRRALGAHCGDLCLQATVGMPAERNYRLSAALLNAILIALPSRSTFSLQLF